MTIAVWQAEPLADRVDIGEATLATLDTVSVDGRRVTASLNGTVQVVGTDGAAYVGTPDHAFAVRGTVADSLRVEDHVLATGRVRDGHGGRYLDAEALTVVTGQVRPAPRSGERLTVQPED